MRSWRGSLLPLECAALKKRGRCAAQREQAPSPQVVGGQAYGVEPAGAASNIRAITPRPSALMASVKWRDILNWSRPWRKGTSSWSRRRAVTGLSSSSGRRCARGEGACSRLSAQRSKKGAAAQPSGSKLPRHRLSAGRLMAWNLPAPHPIFVQSHPGRAR